MARCCGYIISDTGYKLLYWGWIVFAFAIMTAGLIMTVVGGVQGKDAPASLIPFGVLTMFVSAIIGITWVCWIYKRGCCSDQQCCSSDTTVYL